MRPAVLAVAVAVALAGLVITGVIATRARRDTAAVLPCRLPQPTSNWRWAGQRLPWRFARVGGPVATSRFAAVVRAATVFDQRVQQTMAHACAPDVPHAQAAATHACLTMAVASFDNAIALGQVSAATIDAAPGALAQQNPWLTCGQKSAPRGPPSQPHRGCAASPARPALDPPRAKQPGHPHR